MDVPLSPEQEAELGALAASRGRRPSELATELLTSSLEHERWFISEVEKGLAQADQGELIEHDEVVRRIEQRLSG